MREYKIAAIPGDGIGAEVIAAGLQVLGVLSQRDGGFKLKVEEFPWSSAYYKKHGYYIPDGGLDHLKTFDAIFFGAVGAHHHIRARRRAQHWVLGWRARFDLPA